MCSYWVDFGRSERREEFRLPRMVSDDPILVLADPDILPDPYPRYARLRTEKPAFYYDRLGSWMFSTY